MPDCIDCNACCRYVVVDSTPPSHADAAFFKARGMIWNPATRRVWIPSRCPQLQDDGKCRIYATRPLACRTFAKDGEDCHECIRVDEFLTQLK